MTLTSDSPASVVASRALSLALGQGGGGSGELPISIPAFGADENPTYPVGVVAGSYFVDGDNGNDANNGIRVEDGGTGPWATIRKATDTLDAGDTCYVRASATPYSFTGTTQGSSYVKGHVFANSGTPGNWIRVIGYPGERPVIDQGGVDSANGFHINGKSYIQILNFEIRNVYGSGVDLSNGSTVWNDNIVVKFCHIHDINGPAGANVACIKANLASNCTFADNKLHTVRLEGVLNDNANPFIMYDSYNYLVEYNDMYDAKNGVFQKTPPELAQDVGVWRFNNVHDVDVAFYFNNNTAEPITDGFNNLYIVQNVIYNAAAIFKDTSGVAKAASQTLWLFNNTVDGADVSINGFQDARLVNNIFYGSGCRVSTNFDADAASNPEKHVPSISDVGHNLWADNVGVVVDLDIYGSTTKSYRTLAAWQAAPADSPDTLSAASPGVGSIVGDPLFTDAANNDYTLQGSSPALNAGRDGVTMGAYITGSETIGASW